MTSALTSILIPVDLTTVQKGEALSVGTGGQEIRGLPATFTMRVFDVPQELSSLPHDEALRQVAIDRLGREYIFSENFHHGGLEVSAATLEGRHFFVYDPTTDRAVEFLSGYEGGFESDLFLGALESLTL